MRKHIDDSATVGEFSETPAPKRKWLPDPEPCDPPSQWRKVIESRYEH